MYVYVMSVLRENVRCITAGVVSQNSQNYYVVFSDLCRYDNVMFLTLYAYNTHFIVHV